MTYLLASDRGNRWLCNLVSEKIGSGFAGRMEIDRIRDLKIDSVDARGVRFFPPKGPAAIDAPRVVMAFNPWQLLRGQYGWRRADIDRPRVRVAEQEDGKTNMEALFASPRREPKQDAQAKGGSPVLMENMVTKDATLLIYGGSLPKLDLTHLDGVMRIDISPSGEAVLRFDGYRGHLAGLPTGALDFRDVKGQVWTGGKRLLHFDGDGKSKDQPVRFELNITRKPTDVHIDARFPQTTEASVTARVVSMWSKFSANLDLKVHRGH